MASPVTIKVHGLREIEQSLKQFSKATGKAVLTRALKKVAAPIASKAKDMAPVDTGALRDSIKVEVIRTSAGKAAYAAAMSGGASAAEASVAAHGANRAAAGLGASAVVRIRAAAPHAHILEFGSIATRAQPFMRPATLGAKSSSIETVKSELRTEIEATARRIAKRKS